MKTRPAGTVDITLKTQNDHVSSTTITFYTSKHIVILYGLEEMRHRVNNIGGGGKEIGQNDGDVSRRQA
jgi:hypothetical protein